MAASDNGICRTPTSVFGVSNVPSYTASRTVRHRLSSSRSLQPSANTSPRRSPESRTRPTIVREGEAGRKVADLVWTHGITEQTYYRWKVKYGGMGLSEMQRLKQLEEENRRLKQIVAEQALDIQALKAVVAKKW